MKHKFFIIVLLSVSAITVASPLQEKLRVVATKTAEIKDNVKSGDWFVNNKCNSTGGCRVNSCKQ